MCRDKKEDSTRTKFAEVYANGGILVIDNPFEPRRLSTLVSAREGRKSEVDKSRNDFTQEDIADFIFIERQEKS